MLGQLIFGQPPLGTFPKPPHVERGWIKQCKESGGWVKRGKNELDTLPCGYSAANNVGGKNEL